MATILPFPAPRGGDWTASERAGLNELAARFAGEAGIEVAFGRTDAGDPWCVVLDARDEVLVHIAREGRDFVAHTATARSKYFDLNILPNKSGRLVLKKAGKFDYYCRYHPTMTGTITVTE